MNLLFLTDGESSHYVPIHKFDSLMMAQKSRRQHKAFFCHWCLLFCTVMMLSNLWMGT